MKNSGNPLTSTAMEPMLPAEGSYPPLVDLATEVVARANSLSAKVHPIMANSIGDLVRSMNCYYSNLIEGHDTHPRDINRALQNDYSKNSKKRALQKEARAHIDVQKLIDTDAIPFSMSSDYLLTLHRHFCEKLPEELLWVENLDSKQKVIVQPGVFREVDVQVGSHVAVPPDHITHFMHRFEQAYDLSRLDKIKQIIAVGASHHRLLWIHPFLDGNGRVARLFAHGFLRHIDIGSTLWSVSRGLARDVASYKTHLMNADSPRQGNYDGRGALSNKALVALCEFFLQTCLDQINYMESLIEPKELLTRIELYVREQQAVGKLPKGAMHLLRESILRGEVERGRAAEITGHKERQARTVLRELLNAGLLMSDTARGAVRLAFPMDIIERWFPKLYPVSL